MIYVCIGLFIMILAFSFFMASRNWHSRDWPGSP